MSVSLGTWMGLLALVGLAQGRRRVEEPVQDPCGLDKVYADNQALTGFRFEPGYATGASEAEALDAARESAKQALMDKLGCAGKPAWADEYCDAIRMNVDPWSGNARQGRGRTWEACATAALHEDHLKILSTAAAQLDLDMAVLASTVTSAAKGRTLAFMSPTWASGCAAGDEGATLVTSLRRSFGHLQDPPTLLVGGGAELGPDARRLLLRLDEQRGKVVATASLVDPTSCTEQPVGSLTFPSVLLDIPDGSAGRCATDPLLGTTARGICAGPLAVEVDVPTRDGVLCPGEVLSPVVRVSQPARVQVFSVTADGTSTLIFPMDGASDLVQDELSLGAFDAVYEEGAGEERLLAVAVPDGQAFGLTRSWKGWCQVPGSWRSDLVPGSAAIAASTYAVLAPGHGDCARGPAVIYRHDPPPRCGQ